MDVNKNRWISRAINAGSYIALSPSVVSESYHIIMTAFGEQWLNIESQKCDVRARGIFSGHLLLNDLATSGPQQVSSNVELAHYLKEFATDQYVMELIERMKSEDHYENHLLELATAFRFKRAGLGVTFEPITAKGKADILITMADRAWVVECTRQNISSAVRLRVNLRNSLVAMISKAVSQLQAGITVKVTLRPNAGQAQPREATGAVKRLAKSVRQQPSNTFACQSDLLHVEVKRFDDAADPNPEQLKQLGKDHSEVSSSDWDAVMDLSKTPRKDYERFDSGHQVPLRKIPTNRIFIKIESDESQAQDIEIGIVKRIEKKLSQTTSTEDQRPRLIVVQTLGLLEKCDWSMLGDHITRIFRGHERLAGISLVNRRYVSITGRHRYAHILNVNYIGSCPFPESVFHRMKQLEESSFY